MTTIRLAEASKLTGRNRSTLHRAMKAGRLSYSINEIGERRIDVAELERVFGLKARTVGFSDLGNGATSRRATATLQSNATQPGVGASLEQRVADRDATIARLDDAIRDLRAGLDDLRHRLDTSEAERRQLSERLHGLLTARVETTAFLGPAREPRTSNDTRPEPDRVAPVGYRVRWWQWWLR